jgi:DNA-binding PadR family transcriptional regulator
MTSDPEQLKLARKLLPLSEATFLILAALHQPRHGYGIMQATADAATGQPRLGPGTLYGALNNLLKQRLIQRAGDEASAERRKLYALTPLGLATAQLECERLEALARTGRQFLSGKEDLQ